MAETTENDMTSITTGTIYAIAIHGITGRQIAEGWLPANTEVTRAKWGEVDEEDGTEWCTLTVKRDGGLFLERVLAADAEAAGVPRPKRKPGRPKVGGHRRSVRLPEWAPALAEARGETLAETVRAGLERLRSDR